MAALVALSCLLGGAIGPVLVWHQSLIRAIGGFHLSLGYVVIAFSPWLLLLLGVVCLLPVAVSAGRHPESRLYPRARRGYFNAGIALYLLGAVLAAQAAELWSYTT
jgi:hypothetical protein